MAQRLSENGSARALASRLLLSAAVACLATACAKGDRGRLPAPKYYGQKAERPEQPQGPLQAALAYWAHAYAKNPNDPRTALSYALNLKAAGANDKAKEVLVAGHRANPDDAQIAFEYGRMALKEDDLPTARRLLDVAERNTRKPDWRLLSAKGTLLAKQGDHAAAQRYYQNALQQKPDSTATLNNLALSYALDGKADRAEELLRRAIARGDNDARIRQNMALVLGLQGKYDEGKQLAQADMSSEQADSNMTFLRNNMQHRPGDKPRPVSGEEDDAPPPAPPALAQTKPDQTPKLTQQPKPQTVAEVAPKPVVQKPVAKPKTKDASVEKTDKPATTAQVTPPKAPDAKTETPDKTGTPKDEVKTETPGKTEPPSKDDKPKDADNGKPKSILPWLKEQPATGWTTTVAQETKTR